MNIIADTHTHTLAVDHAYSTLAENVAAAKAKGLAAIAMTEHSPSMPGAPSYLHFTSIRMVPREIDGIVILKGIEVNIMDYDGALDFEDCDLKRLDWVIASMHTTNIKPATIKEHTRGWLAVAKNPNVDVIGHCGDGRYEFEIDTVLKAFKEYNKIVEINSHSFGTRPNTEENCLKIAKRCAELEIPIVVSSDAHHASRIGDFAKSIDILKAVDFPEHLVLNADKDRFFAAVDAIKKLR